MEKRERTITLYKLLSSVIGAYQVCKRTGNQFAERHEANIRTIERSVLPSGSGIDSGCKIDLERSTQERIVITTAFHHMNDAGYYNGWSEHTVTVTPSLLSDISISISGRDRNQIKEYLADTFREAMKADVIERYDATANGTTYRLAIFEQSTHSE